MSKEKKLKCGVCGIALAKDNHTVDIYERTMGEIGISFVKHIVSLEYGHHLCCLCKQELEKVAEQVSKEAGERMKTALKKLRQARKKPLPLERYKLRTISDILWRSRQMWSESVRSHDGQWMLAIPEHEYRAAYPEGTCEQGKVYSSQFKNLAGELFEYLFILTDKKSPWHGHKRTKPTTASPNQPTRKEG